MSAALFEEGGGAIGRDDDGRWIVEERGRYRIEAPGAERAIFGGAPLPTVAGGFTLMLSFWTGRAEVLLHRGEATEALALDVGPAKHKLETTEWEALLDAIDRRWPGCTLGVEGGTHGDVGGVGVEPLLAVAALAPLLPELLRNVTALLDALRARDHFPQREAPLHALRRPTVATLRRIAASPSLAASLRGDACGERSDVRVPHRSREVSHDHPANRAIRWLLVRLSLRLRHVASLLRTLSLRETITDARAWCEDRARSLDDGATRLERLVRNSLLFAVEPAPPDTAALLTLSADPLYARVQRRCRRWLSPRFERGEGADASLRPTYELYERWCLLALREGIGEVFPDARWDDSETTATNGGDATVGDVVARGRCAGGTVTLYDNLCFEAWAEQAEHFSISTRRIPDFVVTWRGNDGAARWVVLDAKYRVAGRSLAEALAELHVYRDALRMERYSSACAGALLLIPKESEDSARWRSEKFVERFRFGCATLRPGAPVAGVARRIRAWLLDEAETAP